MDGFDKMIMAGGVALLLGATSQVNWMPKSQTHLQKVFALAPKNSELVQAALRQSTTICINQFAKRPVPRVFYSLMGDMYAGVVNTPSAKAGLVPTSTEITEGQSEYFKTLVYKYSSELGKIGQEQMRYAEEFIKAQGVAIAFCAMDEASNILEKQKIQ